MNKNENTEEKEETTENEIKGKTKKVNGKRNVIIGIALGLIGSVVVGVGIGKKILNSNNSNICYRTVASLYGIPGGQSSSFNGQFTPYISSSATADQVRSLLSTIISSNRYHDNHLVTVEASGIGFVNSFSINSYQVDKIESVMSKLRASYKYNVEATYNKDGYIEKITIK